jgi:hypothetical protein
MWVHKTYVNAIMGSGIKLVYGLLKVEYKTQHSSSYEAY